MADSKEAGILGESPDGKLTKYDGIVNDPDMDGLSLYEKKALLVNRELDSHGMGKYQWYHTLHHGCTCAPIDLVQVHLFPLRNGIHDRFALRASVWIDCACIATRVGLFKYVCSLAIIKAAVDPLQLRLWEISSRRSTQDYVLG